MFMFVKRRIIVILAILVAIVFVYNFTYTNRGSNLCYRHKSESLPSILESKPAKDKSIFFHETSCNSERNGKLVINARQACAVESAAVLNPGFDVYLLYVSPGIIKNEGSESDNFLQALLSYKNVKIRHLDFGEYLQGTLLEELWKSGAIERSNFVQSHASDVLRYLTLWRFGGIYLDLDVIVIKSLEYLPLNYAGAESDSLVAAGVLGFETTGNGHVLATQCLRDLKDNFSGTSWINNGPGVVTRLAKNVCASESVSDLIGNTCLGKFKVYPPEAFYPVPWENWTIYFDDTYTEEIEKKSEDSYVLHMWNKLSSDRKISVMEQVPYSLFAKKFCPKVYRECRAFF